MADWHYIKLEFVRDNNGVKFTLCCTLAVLRDFFDVVGDCEIEGFNVTTNYSHSRDGMRAILTCFDPQNATNLTLKLDIEIAIEVAGWHKGLSIKLPQPRARYLPRIDPRTGRKPVRENLIERIKSEMETGDLSVTYTSCLEGAPRSLTLRELRRLPRIERSKVEQAETDAKNRRRLWRLDTCAIEERILYDGFEKDTQKLMTSAMKFYTIMSTLEKQPLPRLNKSLRRNVALWALRGRNETVKTVTDALTSICDVISTVLTTNQCSSFVLRGVNLAQGLTSTVTDLKMQKFESFRENLKTCDFEAIEGLCGVDHSQLEK